MVLFSGERDDWAKLLPTVSCDMAVKEFRAQQLSYEIVEIWGKVSANGAWLTGEEDDTRQSGSLVLPGPIHPSRWYIRVELLFSLFPYNGTLSRCGTFFVSQVQSDCGDPIGLFQVRDVGAFEVIVQLVMFRTRRTSGGIPDRVPSRKRHGIVESP
jgi:hypothetical protein